jgi:hypothetical protein
MIRPFMSSLGQVDDRDRRFDGVVGGAALDGVGDDLRRALRGGLARLGLEALDQVGGVAPRVGLDLLEQQLARLVGGQARDALQLALPIGQQLLGRGGGGLGALLRRRARRRARAARARASSVAAMRSASARVLSASACSRPAISCCRVARLRSASASRRAPSRALRAGLLS